MSLNVNLGTPYETRINEIIEKGYAATQTEVIRQAIMYYATFLEDQEEIRLLNKGISADMKDIKSGKVKTVAHDELKKKLGL
ncbi:MAG: hypothetical protein A4E28_01668 [Methanocella sp. PtaU1.Bin125]|nr:MAG: hypothetical protein A4E28_01668 [Methanocella sp. PtaU1.Bin125]